MATNNKVRDAILPAAVTKTLKTRASSERHPALAQGILLGHWQEVDRERERARRANRQPAPRDKADEARRQKDNLTGFFRGRDAKSILSEIIARQRDLAPPPAMVHDRELAVTYRLVTGFGFPNMLETNLGLHPLYGVPYLAGSALKGATQGYLLQRWAADAGIPRLTKPQREQLPGATPTPLAAFEQALLAAAGEDPAWNAALQGVDDALGQWRNQNPPQAMQSHTDQRWNDWRAKTTSTGESHACACGRTFVGLFGSPDRQGQVVFLDALPTKLNIRVDVLTPHFKPYAEQVLPPADYHDPEPIPFLVVDEGSTFSIAVLALKPNADAYAQAALDLIEQALRVTGMGAKTSTGYGRLKV